MRSSYRNTVNWTDFALHWTKHLILGLGRILGLKALLKAFNFPFSRAGSDVFKVRRLFAYFLARDTRFRVHFQTQTDMILVLTSILHGYESGGESNRRLWAVIAHEHAIWFGLAVGFTGLSSRISTSPSFQRGTTITVAYVIDDEVVISISRLHDLASGSNEDHLA